MIVGIANTTVFWAIIQCKIRLSCGFGDMCCLHLQSVKDQKVVIKRVWK